MADKGDQELAAMGVVFGALSELSAEAQQRVLDWVVRRLNLGTPEESPSSVAPSAGYIGSAGPKRGTESATPKQFLVEKRPRSDVERIACLAYYLTHYRQTTEFKTKDLTLLNREAAQPALGNAAMAVSNATALSQYLVSTTAGRKQITPRGEGLVEALPDRERVNDALELHPLVGRNRKRRGSKRHKGEA